MTFPTLLVSRPMRIEVKSEAPFVAEDDSDIGRILVQADSVEQVTARSMLFRNVTVTVEGEREWWIDNSLQEEAGSRLLVCATSEPA